MSEVNKVDNEINDNIREIDINKLQTGDLVLYHWIKGPTNTWVNWFLNLFNRTLEHAIDSPWSHIGMVLKDPVWINDSVSGKPLKKGIYIWESSYEGFPDSEDHKTKLGVQIVPLKKSIENFPGDTYARRLTTTKFPFSIDKLKEIHRVVHDKPYDFNPIDWFEALIKDDPDPDKTSRFWCSALVAYFYTELGLLDPDTDWSIVRPSDFSYKHQIVRIIDGTLGELEKLKKDNWWWFN